MKVKRLYNNLIVEVSVCYAQVLYYYSIPEFFHAIAIIPTLICSNYAHFIIEKTPWTRGTNIPPTGVHLSPLRMSLSSCWSLFDSEFSQLTLPNLFAATWWFVHAPCYIIPSQCSNAFGLQLFPYYVQYDWLKPSWGYQDCPFGWKRGSLKWLTREDNQWK